MHSVSQLIQNNIYSRLLKMCYSKEYIVRQSKNENVFFPVFLTLVSRVVNEFIFLEENAQALFMNLFKTTMCSLRVRWNFHKDFVDSAKNQLPP